MLQKFNRIWRLELFEGLRQISAYAGYIFVEEIDQYIWVFEYGLV